MTTPQQSGADNEEATETVELPVASFPAAKEGDTIELTVVSVDAEGGTITATPAEAEEPAEEEGGSDAMAAEIGNQATK